MKIYNRYSVACDKLDELWVRHSDALAAIEAKDRRIAELEVENAAWREKAAVWMASPEAQKQLAGYRELGDKCVVELEALLQEVTFGHRTPADWEDQVKRIEAAIAAKGE